MAEVNEVLRALAKAVIYEYDQCVGEEGPSWDLCEQAKAALAALPPEFTEEQIAYGVQQALIQAMRENP